MLSFMVAGSLWASMLFYEPSRWAGPFIRGGRAASLAWHAAAASWWLQFDFDFDSGTWAAPGRPCGGPCLLGCLLADSVPVWTSTLSPAMSPGACH